MTDESIPRAFNRRKFLGLAGGTLAASFVPGASLGYVPPICTATERRAIEWHDVRAWGVEGKG